MIFSLFAVPSSVISSFLESYTSVDSERTNFLVSNSGAVLTTYAKNKSIHTTANIQSDKKIITIILRTFFLLPFLVNLLTSFDASSINATPNINKKVKNPPINIKLRITPIIPTIPHLTLGSSKERFGFFNL